MSESSPQPKPRTAPIGSGRAGKVRRAFEDLVSEARSSGRMTAEHELVAALAGKVAAVVDRAAREGDAAGMLRAINSLRDMLDTLPVRSVGGEVNPGDGAGSRRAEIVQLYDSPPAVGDAADA